MLWLVVLFLVLTLFVSREEKGPLWAMSIAWLICILPIASGILSFSYLSSGDLGFSLKLIGFLSCFVAGVLSQHVNSPGVIRPASAFLDYMEHEDYFRTLRLATAVWWLATAGTLCLCVDFYMLSGAGLDDLATLRELVINKPATIFAKVGSVLTWGCLYCYAFALIYRERLTRLRFLRFVSPVAGYFLVALFSAGRQSAFQIMIFTILILMLSKARRRSQFQRRVSRGGAYVATLVVVLMISYMGYIASARNDALISDDVTEVLVKLFDFEMPPQFERLVGKFGGGVKTTVVGGLVYFSSATALFSKFLQIDLPRHYFGAMSFPFFFRQLEPITNISVLGALEEKIELMRAAGVIGAGWTTGVSSYVLDFGIPGGALFLFLQGYYSSFAWRRALGGMGFHDGVIAIVMLTAAIYMPFLAATAETNLLLLFAFCAFSRHGFRSKVHQDLSGNQWIVVNRLK